MTYDRKRTPNPKYKLADRITEDDVADIYSYQFNRAAWAEGFNEGIKAAEQAFEELCKLDIPLGTD